MREMEPRAPHQRTSSAGTCGSFTFTPNRSFYFMAILVLSLGKLPAKTKRRHEKLSQNKFLQSNDRFGFSLIVAGRNMVPASTVPSIASRTVRTGGATTGIGNGAANRPPHAGGTASCRGNLHLFHLSMPTSATHLRQTPSTPLRQARPPRRQQPRDK